MSETELMTFAEMQDLVDKLRLGSGILFGVLQQVYALHDLGEDEENCAECSQVYPCNTAQLLFNNFVEQEETPAE